MTAGGIKVSASREKNATEKVPRTQKVARNCWIGILYLYDFFSYEEEGIVSDDALRIGGRAAMRRPTFLKWEW